MRKFLCCFLLSLPVQPAFGALGDDDEDAPDPAAKADVAPPSGTRVGSRVAVYSDDDGLTVVTPIVSFKQKIFDTTELGVEYDADILSAATVDVRTTATQKFREVRHGVAVSGTHRVKAWETDLAGAVSYSHEADYQSLTVGGGFSTELLDKNVTLGAGYSFVGNQVGRSHTTFDQFSDSLQIHALNLSFTQLTSKRGFLQLSGSVIGNFGYQASVYRYVPVFLEGSVTPERVDEASLLDGTVSPVARPAERLPYERIRAAAAVRVNQGFESGTYLAGDYRLYADDWAVLSHTLSLSVYQHLPAGLVFRLRNRFYTQSASKYFQRVFFIADPGEQPEYLTSDRELGTFIYDMLGAKLTLELPKSSWFESASIDLSFDIQYTSYSDFAFLPERTAYMGGTGFVFEL